MDPAWKKAVVENNKSFISCSPSDGKTNERDLTGPSLCGPLLWAAGNQGTPVWSWHTAMAEVLHWSPWPRSHISHYPRYISGPRRHSSAETQRCGRQRAGAVNPVTQPAAAPGPAPAPPHPPCYSTAIAMSGGKTWNSSHCPKCPKLLCLQSMSPHPQLVF